jgi:hypothetical protein
VKRTINDASLFRVSVNAPVVIRRYACAIIYSKSHITEIIKKSLLGYYLSELLNDNETFVHSL